MDLQRYFSKHVSEPQERNCMYYHTFLSPSSANQIRAQSLDYVLSPQCISTATQIQITFSIFSQNLFHICLHLLIRDFCAQPLVTSKQQLWLTHSPRSNKYIEHLNSCYVYFPLLVFQNLNLKNLRRSEAIERCYQNRMRNNKILTIS